MRASEWCTAEGGDGARLCGWAAVPVTGGRAGTCPRGARTCSRVEADTRRATRDRANVLQRGWLAKMQGDLDVAADYLAKSIEVRRALGDKVGLAGTLNILGLVTQARGDLEGAMRLYDEGLAIQRELSNKRGIAGVLLNMGVLALTQGNVEDAEKHWQERRTAFRAAGDRLYTAGVLCNLGNAAMRRKDLVAARDRYTESLQLFREYGSPGDVALLVEGFAGLAMASGYPKRAARLYGAAAAMRDRTGAAIAIEDKADHERAVAEVRAAIGAEAFETALNTGRGVGEAAAIKESLEQWTGKWRSRGGGGRGSRMGRFADPDDPRSQGEATRAEGLEPSTS